MKNLSSTYSGWGRCLVGAWLLLGLLAPVRPLRAQITDPPFVQGVTLGTLRNDYTGFVGMHFTTGSGAIEVSSLGRHMVAGNTGTHRLKLVEASSGNDVAGSLVSLSMSGGTPGAFKYAPLPGPVTLSAATAYYLVSEETNGGDQWYNDNTQVELSAPPTGTGSGTGLAAAYYNTLDLSGAGALDRIDATVDFTWPTSPGAGVNADQFSARWTGQVLAPVMGSYTFSTRSDDGIRLWVNGQQLINHWTDHAPADDAGTITLTAGQKYEIKLEFYENGGGAEARLQWAYPGQAKQAIPQSQLFPAVSVPIGTAGGPAGYTRCSGEGETCVLTGTMDVAYGANGAFVYLTNRTGPVACNNGTFTDPITGVIKSCYVKASGAATTVLAPAGAGLSLSAYPNPSPGGRATLRLTVHAAQTATVHVYDARGRLVGLFSVPLHAGQTDFKVPATLPAGTFHLQTTLDGQAQRFTLKVE